MNKKRKIAAVSRQVTFAEAEENDLHYWAGKSIKDRVTEATDWISKVWAFHQKMHGAYCSLPDGKHRKQSIDEDDF